MEIKEQSKIHSDPSREASMGLFKSYSFLNMSPSVSISRLCLSVLLTIGLFACSSPAKPKNQAGAEKPTEKKSDDSNLTVFGGTLDATDETGRLIWRVNAQKARYTKEREMGQAENPYAELYQDGKIVYQVTAEKADIEQNGKQLLLRGKIVAIDPQNGVELRGNELEWRPKEDLLIVRNQLNVKHKQLLAVAQEARAKTREQRVDFFGGVVANSLEPPLQMRTEHLTWQVKQQKLFGDRPIQFDRYQNNKITDRGKGDSAEVDLKTKIVTITKNAQVDLAQPQVQITSNLMAWNLNSQIVTTKSPVRVFHRTENTIVTANEGELRIPQNTVYLRGNVNGVGQRRQAIKSDKLTWFLNNQQVEAQGNVVYQQADPPLTFAGDTATGNIVQEKIVVKGGNSGKVVTEIIPN
jgi:LPS export ABC transporter protein LptC